MRPIQVSIAHAGLIALIGLAVLGPGSPVRSQTPPGADVIIVGAGISGLSAALEAARGGVEVQFVDVWSVYGGHAVMSGGGVAIIDSDFQRAHGIVDTPELASEDFFNRGEDPDPYWVDYYTQNSRVELGQWLESLGVRWLSLNPQPGNSVRRFHRTDGRGLGLVTPIYREVLRHPNVSFRWNFRVTELLVEQGRVTGVRGEDTRSGEADELRAPRVLLATGGFQSNLEMVRRFWPAHLAEPGELLIGSGLNSVGSGHDLASRVDAGFHRMDHQWNYPWGLPHPQYPGEGRALAARNEVSIWVNGDGRRFVNELADPTVLLAAVVAQSPSTYWAIFDDDDNESFYVSGSGWDNFQRIREEILDNALLTTQAATLAELAHAIGQDAGRLGTTVARYNAMVEQGVDEDFGRFSSADDLAPLARIDQPPFYAIQFFPMTRKSMGGVRVDRQMRVVREDGTPIPGLYASGELTGFAGVNGSAGLEGTFLGPAILTGRVAGWTLLREVAEARELHRPELEIESGLPPRTLSPSETASCDGCHRLQDLVATPRPGYAHFDRVHRVVMAEQRNCGACHQELSPFDASNHVIDRQLQTQNCVHCHLVVE